MLRAANGADLQTKTVADLYFMVLHTCHTLPPSEIDLGLFWADFKGSGGNIYFTELAERVEYGNHVLVVVCAGIVVVVVVVVAVVGG